MIDNDDDGVAEESASVACGLMPGLVQDPVGQLEEDVYLHPVLDPIKGKTKWVFDGSDMICTGIVLELVSKKDLTGKWNRIEEEEEPTLVQTEIARFGVM